MNGQLRFDGREPDRASTTSRDLAGERVYLSRASRGSESFVRHAEQRLAAGDETYGDSFRWVGIHKLLRELVEESVDLAAWAALADQTLDGDVSLSDARQKQLRAVLAGVAEHGARAHALLATALTSLEGGR